MNSREIKFTQCSDSESTCQIAYQQLTQAESPQLIAYLKQKQITSLDILCSTIDCRILADVLQKVPLIALSLCSGVSSNVQTLFRALHTNDKLKSLSISCILLTKSDVTTLSEILRANTSLTTLRLSECQLSDSHAEILVNALFFNFSLKNLSLDMNKISASGMQLFSTLLYTNTSLRSLDISGNKKEDQYYFGDKFNQAIGAKNSSVPGYNKFISSFKHDFGNQVTQQDRYCLDRETSNFLRASWREDRFVQGADKIYKRAENIYFNTERECNHYDFARMDQNVRENQKRENLKKNHHRSLLRLAMIPRILYLAHTPQKADVEQLNIWVNLPIEIIYQILWYVFKDNKTFLAIKPNKMWSFFSSPKDYNLRLNQIRKSSLFVLQRIIELEKNNAAPWKKPVFLNISIAHITLFSVGTPLNILEAAKGLKEVLKGNLSHSELYFKFKQELDSLPLQPIYQQCLTNKLFTHIPVVQAHEEDDKSSLSG